MIDREKVTEELQLLRDFLMSEERKAFKGNNNSAVYVLMHYRNIVIDAIALLKEQEAKPIVRKQGKCENPDGSIDYFAEWYCPHCGKLLSCGFGTPWVKFCHKCGGAVKFDDI